MMNTEQGVSAFPEGENLFKWIGTITGPSDTVRLCDEPLQILEYRILMFCPDTGVCWSHLQINFGVSTQLSV